MNEKTNDKSFSVEIAQLLSIGVQEQIQQLNTAFEISKPSSQFAASWSCKTKVFVGDANGRHHTRLVGSDRVVVLDWDSYVKLVLIIYWIGIDGEDVVAQGLAAFLLVGYVVGQKDEFPEIDNLLRILHARNSTLLDHLFTLVGNLLLFHELGHLYYESEGHNFLPIKFTTPDRYTRDDWFHSDSPLYEGCTPFAYEISEDGSKLGSILIGDELEDWREEFACDAFALYALLFINSDEAHIRESDVSHVCTAMSISQLILWIVTWQQHMRLGQKDNAEAAKLSHPPSKLRFDFLVFQALRLANEYLPANADIPLGSVLEQACVVWGEDLMGAMHDGIEYSFYGFDEGSDQVNVGKIVSFVTGGHILHHPSAFQQIHRKIMTEFIPNAQVNGWDAASRDINTSFSNSLTPIVLTIAP